jgi:uncharacterized protein (TIGR03435 family)
MQSQRLTLGAGVRMPDEVYDIEATVEKGTFPPEVTTEARFDKMKLMLQALLEDRFQLKVRRESKEQPVYALMIGNGGPKLETSRFQEPHCNEEIGPKLISNHACHWLDGDQYHGLHGGSVTIAQVVEAIQDWTDRPVLDKTGITGFYDIQTEPWIPLKADGISLPCDASFHDPDRQQTLFNVFEKLGLRLEPQRALIDLFVIDHIEKPSEN